MDKLRKVYVKRRKSDGFSQSDLAVGISKNSISKFEGGGDIMLSNFVGILGVMGYRLVIVDNEAFKNEEGD